MSIPRLRFAPSPNGYLHQGHAFSLLENQRLAKALNGELLLRIEDIDLSRRREEYVQAIIDDCAWLGVEFSGDIRRQSQHFAFYEQGLKALEKQGLLYPSFETRAELAALGDLPKDPDGAVRFPLPVKFQAKESAQFVLRLDMRKALALTGALSWQDFVTGETHFVDGEAWGDVVIKRKDIPTSYHLSVTMDDDVQNITHIVRGKDLEASTDIHVILQKLLGLNTPLYNHHDLVKDEAGEKLSKSRLSTPFRENKVQIYSARPHAEGFLSIENA